MLPLKQLPLVTLPVPANINKLSNNNELINHNNILGYKFRLSCPDKSLETRDVSHQEIINHIKGYSKIKRRISTAGTANRFPKDFFMEDRENLHRKEPLLMLKWRKSQLGSQRGYLQAKRKQYSLNIDVQLADTTNAIHTPKFNQPQNNDSQNQFLIQKPPKAITPFPVISQIKIESIEQSIRSTRPNFIKKIKKGQYLKQKLDSIRSQTLNKQNSPSYHRVYSVHQTQ